MIVSKSGSSRYHHKTQSIGVLLAFRQLFRQLFRLLAVRWQVKRDLKMAAGGHLV
jgi:hypothetical protein